MERTKSLAKFSAAYAAFGRLPECDTCEHEITPKRPCLNPALWKNSPGARPGGRCRAHKEKR